MPIPAVLRRSWLCYALSVCTIVAGSLLAARSYPGGFDWTHRVMSALASQKHNPDGSAWFAGALGLAMALLWPVVTAVGSSGTAPPPAGRRSRAVLALRAGIVCAILVAVDRLVFFHLSDVLRKGHEILALGAFAGIYAGVVGLQVAHLRRGHGHVWSVILVLVPLVAVGISEFVLYLGQRGIGWVDHDWSQDDLPVWARFAFWQWLAATGLWLGLGHLLLLAGRTKPQQHD